MTEFDMPKARQRLLASIEKSWAIAAESEVLRAVSEELIRESQALRDNRSWLLHSPIDTKSDKISH